MIVVGTFATCTATENKILNNILLPRLDFKSDSSEKKLSTSSEKSPKYK